MRMWFTEYPPRTLIKCVMVGGDAHGRVWARLPEDAHGFKIMKSSRLPASFLAGPNDDAPLGFQETVWYDTFAEIFSHDGFIRLFSVQSSRDDRPSILMIADALRIAGCE